jgi:hypothetical protein
MEENQSMSNINNPDEITLKELILKLKDYALELAKNWYIILLFILPIAGYMVYKAKTTDTIFPAKLTFMLSQDDGGLGKIGGLLGSFGLGGSGKNNYEKMVEIAKSRQIIYNSIFNNVEINGKTDYLANHLINLEKLHDKLWEKDTSGLKSFYFTNSDIQKFSKLESKAFIHLHKYLTGSGEKAGIYNCSFSKTSEILTMSISTVSEPLSIELLKTIFYNLSDFYVETSIGRDRFTYDIIKRKSDSIYNLLNAKDYAASKIQDAKRNLFEESEKNSTKKLNRDVNMLGVIYGETAKNAELADFSLKSKTPLIRELDLPMAPLDAKSESAFMALIKGCLIGGILASFFIILRKIIREAMAA